ncbi:uncharacterized protein LOC134162496, partial [Pezoporus occidentalis]|uniref:uncharacterized protein LOC134162496 n=1 Tax=Pezoporus occidentalis TaxID=407982 RepID=UPI002F90C7E2
MTIHNLYIFDRSGTCLHYSEWHRRRQAGIPKEEEFKLMFGMLFSLRSFVSKMSPTDMRDGFLSFHTSRYRLHYYETPSGLRLVLNTDLGVSSAREALQHIYSNVSASNGPKTDPNGPKTASNRPKTAPNGPKTDPNGPKTAPNGPKSTSNRPKTAPNGPKTDPKPPQTDPKPPQTDPKPPQTDPKPPQIDPKLPQMDPKPPQIDPKLPQRDPKPPQTDPKPPEIDP